MTHCEHLKDAREQGVPVVLLDRDLPQLDFDSVVADNETATYAAITHLLDLGHERIGLLASISASEQPEIRAAADGSWSVLGADRPSVEGIRGYLRALADRGAPVTAEAITLIAATWPVPASPRISATVSRVTSSRASVSSARASRSFNRAIALRSSPASRRAAASRRCSSSISEPIRHLLAPPETVGDDTSP
jgi:hypothetical protein